MLDDEFDIMRLALYAMHIAYEMHMKMKCKYFKDICALKLLGSTQGSPKLYDLNSFFRHQS